MDQQFSVPVASTAADDDVALQLEVERSKSAGPISNPRPEVQLAAAVVIPCYNAEKWVARAVESVLQQEVPGGCEIIVVDDGSVDGSLEVLRRFGDRIRLKTGPNRGACHARNRGLALASADHVLFLDADDELSPGVLPAALRLASESRADIVLSRMQIRRNDGRISWHGPFLEPLNSKELFRNWFRGWQLNPSALLWRRAFLERIGGWDENVILNQDGEIFLRALLHEPQLAQNHEGHGIYNLNEEGSLSQKPSGRQLRGQIRVQEKIVGMIKGTPFEGCLEGVHYLLYQTARRAFLDGHVEVGRDAMATLRRLGFYGHFGSKKHVLIASIMGLEAKSRLWG